MYALLPNVFPIPIDLRDNFAFLFLMRVDRKLAMTVLSVHLTDSLVTHLVASTLSPGVNIPVISALPPGAMASMYVPPSDPL